MRLSVGMFCFGILALGIGWIFVYPLFQALDDVVVASVPTLSSAEALFYSALPFCIAFIILAILLVRVRKGKGED
jgi:TRAP-type C4-dicarboxylate transport system permease small subunit